MLRARALPVFSDGLPRLLSSGLVLIPAPVSLLPLYVRSLLLRAGRILPRTLPSLCACSLLLRVAPSLLCRASPAPLLRELGALSLPPGVCLFLQHRGWRAHKRQGARLPRSRASPLHPPPATHVLDAGAQLLPLPCGRAPQLADVHSLPLQDARALPPRASPGIRAARALQVRAWHGPQHPNAPVFLRRVALSLRPQAVPFLPSLFAFVLQLPRAPFPAPRAAASLQAPDSAGLRR